MVQYAVEFLETLGKGSSRRAFLLSSKYALKIAINEKGIAQNEAELDVFTNPKSRAIVAKVYDADQEGNKWLISDLVKPLDSEEEFEQLTGVKWYLFSEQIRSHMQNRGADAQKLNPWVQAVIATARQNNLMHGDLRELSHWGKTPDGRCVLLDYGFNESVFQSHYSKTPKPQDKTATSDSGRPPMTAGPNPTKTSWPHKPKPKEHIEGGFPEDDEEKTKR